MTSLTKLLQAKREYERASLVPTAVDSRAAEKAIARSDLLNFTRYTFPGYETNWHHERIGEAVAQLLAGEITRLMLFVPPRHGKSEILSRRLPAFALGQNPDTQIIACSYSADLASRLNRDVQRIIDTEDYREIFPGTTLNSKNVVSTAKGSYLRNSEIFEVVGTRGGYRSAGVGGGITGMGFDIGLIDDPTKNRADAESIAVQEALWDWYTSTFRTRAEKGAKIIIVLTRWHKNDLAGRLLKLAKEDPKADQWTVVSFPAIATDVACPGDPRQEGEALWPGKYPVEELERTKASLGIYDWSSLYQQNPVAEGGTAFNASWCSYWHDRLTTFDRCVLSVDARFKDISTAAYVVLQVWGRVGDRFYLLDQVRDRLGYTDAKDAILAAIDRQQRQGITVTEVFVEAKGNGRVIVESLASDCPCTVVATDFGSDTVGARAQAVASFFQKGSVLIPSSASALWVDGFVTELTEFPSAETDNQVRAMAQALIYLALRETEGSVYRHFVRRQNCLLGQDADDFGFDPNLDLHLSFDWNRSPACAVAAHVRDRELFIFKEWYLLDSDTFELTEAVTNWILESGHSRRIYIYGDASGNAHTANSKQSNWEIAWNTIKTKGLKPRSTKRYGDANPPVTDRVLSCNALFKTEKAFVCLNACPELVKDYEQLRWRDEQIDKRDGARSHLSDAAGYMMHTLFPYKRQGAKTSTPQRPIAGVAG